MILNNKGTFARNSETQTDEGRVYKTWTTYLTDEPCNLQFDDGYIFNQQYGNNADDNTYVLFVGPHLEDTIIRGDVVTIDDGIDYEIERVIKGYTTHVELLLKQRIK